MGIPFSAGNSRAGAQKGVITNFEEQFSVTNMYGWHRVRFITIENVVIMYLSIVLGIVLGENSFKITSRC